MKVRYPKQVPSRAAMARMGLVFPDHVFFESRVYGHTGKFGTHLASGRTVAEYEVAGAHLWVFSDGSIAEVAS